MDETASADLNSPRAPQTHTHGSHGLTRARERIDKMINIDLIDRLIDDMLLNLWSKRCNTVSFTFFHFGLNLSALSWEALRSGLNEISNNKIVTLIQLLNFFFLYSLFPHLQNCYF